MKKLSLRRVDVPVLSLVIIAAASCCSLVGDFRRAKEIDELNDTIKMLYDQNSKLKRKMLDDGYKVGEVYDIIND